MTVRRWGSEKAVSSPGASSSTPNVAALADGGYVIIWDNFSTVFGQRYAADGSRVGSQFTIDNAFNPNITALPDGGFVVSFTQNFGPGDTDPIFARFNASGQLVQQTDIDAEIDEAFHTDVAQLSNGGFVIAYVDGNLNGGDVEVEIRSSTGGFVTQLGPVNTITAGAQWWPGVAGLLNDRFVVVWNNDDTDLRLRVFNSNGTPVNGADVLVNTTPIDTFIGPSPHVTALATGGFVVTYEDDFNNVRARIFDAAGNPLGNDFTVTQINPSFQSFPEVVGLPNGQFAVFWFAGAGVDGIRGQLFDALGVRLGSEFVVSSSFNGASGDGLEAAVLSDGRIVVTWEAGSIVYSQIVDPRDGMVIGDRNNNLLYGHDGLFDDMSGLSGNDVMFGLRGNDQLVGGDGSDRVVGGLGDDTLNGSTNNDFLTGGSERVTTWGLLGAPDRFADFNGDGRADVLEVSVNRIADVFLSSGTSFRSPTIWSGNISQSVTIGDFNGDGRSDLVDFSTGQARVSLSTGSGFSGPANWLSGVVPFERVGDFNNDNRDDLVEISANGNVYVALSNGTNAFNPFTLWGSGALQRDLLADVNNDGRDDLVQLSANGTAYVALSTGATFTNYVAWGSGALTTDVLADFNGDGRDDLLQLHPTNNTAYVALSTGNAFTNFVAWGTGSRPTDRTGDFNGDGRADLIQITEGGTLYVATSVGNSFTNYTAWGFGSRPIDQLADVNGDGRTDVVELHSNGNSYVWLSTGTSFSPYQLWGQGVPTGDGSGADLFVFTGQYGNDIVTDFDAGPGVQDVIQLDASVWSGFADVINHTTDDGRGNTTIAFGGNSITLLGVVRAELSTDDFIFT